MIKIDSKFISNRELRNINFNDLKEKELESTENSISKKNSDLKSISPILQTKEKKKHLLIEIIDKKITEKQNEILIQVLIENELLNSDMSERFINMIFNTLTYKRIKEGIIIFDQNSKFEDL